MEHLAQRLRFQAERVNTVGSAVDWWSETQTTMSAQAKVTVQQPPRATVARVEGDLDLVSLPQVERELRAAAMDSGSKALLAVDVTRVTYLNSAAIRLLYDLAEDLRSRRRELRLVMSSTAPLRTLFRRLRFDTVIPVYDTVDEAIAEAGPPASEGHGGDRPGVPG
jgi:anti-sigma B factor antagonist